MRNIKLIKVAKTLGQQEKESCLVSIPIELRKKYGIHVHQRILIYDDLEHKEIILKPELD